MYETRLCHFIMRGRRHAEKQTHSAARRSYRRDRPNESSRIASRHSLYVTKPEEKDCAFFAIFLIMSLYDRKSKESSNYDGA